MTTTDRDMLISQLREDEGLVKHAYQDSKGYWTIGVGRLIDKRLGGGLSESECVYLLQNDISRVFKEIERLFPWVEQMAPARRVAFANLLFNLGSAKLSKFHSTLPALAAGRYQRAHDHLAATKWATDVQPSRRDRILKAIRDGI